MASKVLPDPVQTQLAKQESLGLSTSLVMPNEFRDKNPVNIKKKGITRFTFIFNKYMLLIETLPYIAIAVVVRVILDNVVHGFNGFYAINDVSTVLSGGIFLIGFMLNGVIADYKEAEKLPGDIAGCLYAMEELILSYAPVKHKGNPKYSNVAVREGILEVTNEIAFWLGAGRNRDDARMYDAVTSLTAKFLQPLMDAAPPASVRLTQEVTNLRRFMTRVNVISSSTYLPAGYALVELFVLMAFVIVVFAKYGSGYNAYAVIVGVAIIYGGMLRLMRDIDDPFEYDTIDVDQVAEGQDGSTEVVLDIFLDYRRALRRRLAADRKAAETAEPMAVVTP